MSCGGQPWSPWRLSCKIYSLLSGRAGRPVCVLWEQQCQELHDGWVFVDHCSSEVKGSGKVWTGADSSWQLLSEVSIIKVLHPSVLVVSLPSCRQIHAAPGDPEGTSCCTTDEDGRCLLARWALNQKSWDTTAADLITSWDSVDQFVSGLAAFNSELERSGPTWWTPWWCNGYFTSMAA